jgi:Tfp pilus assembly protein PilX
MSIQKFHGPADQRGVALITALLMLLVATILAAAMFRSFGTQEKLAGNLREKERALHAAEMAQQYAEASLANGTAGPTGTCNSVVDSTAPQVCNIALANPTSLSGSTGWTAGVQYVPPEAWTGKQMNVTTTSGQDTYYWKPIYYIYDMGKKNGAEYYQIDAMGVGGVGPTTTNGTPNAVAVVESIYMVTGLGKGRQGDTPAAY